LERVVKIEINTFGFASILTINDRRVTGKKTMGKAALASAVMEGKRLTF
jgi:hypothetical protein